MACSITWQSSVYLSSDVKLYLYDQKIHCCKKNIVCFCNQNKLHCDLYLFSIFIIFFFFFFFFLESSSHAIKSSSHLFLFLIYVEGISRIKWNNTQKKENWNKKLKTILKSDYVFFHFQVLLRFLFEKKEKMWIIWGEVSSFYSLLFIRGILK